LGKVLVTGALGVIGKFLVPYLERKGYDVVSTDIQIRDYSNYVAADITSFEHLYRIFREQHIDMVIHMAARVGRLIGESHPQKMVYVNDVGTLNLIKLCMDYGCRLVFFSTSEVYGHLFDDGKTVWESNLEAGSPFLTTNIYAMSKLFGEAIVKHYVENYGLQAVAVRPFMVYGEGEYPSKYHRSAMCNFIHKALTGKKIMVHKGAVRAWCHVSDFAEGVLLVMNKSFPAKKYEAFNIGSDEYHSMEEVAKIVLDECGGSHGQIEMVEPPEKFSTLVKRFSIGKVKSLGYEPKMSLREGIHRVAEWQKEEMRKGAIV
jgi:dTDP-glucose 4,6-dehydratase